MDQGHEFRTVFGRGLVAELPAFVHRPYLVVTMDDLWPKFADALSGRNLAGVHTVRTLELSELEDAVGGLPACGSVVGVGGGQALDLAKFFAWRKRLPIFQVPTAMTVNAPFGHRSGIRDHGVVRYIGWAVPEAVYVDFDVIRSAPPLLNRSGIGDILCYHTAHADWRIARDMGRDEPQWKYDQALVDEARLRLDSVLAHIDDIHAVNDDGIRTLMLAHRWGGATYHASGWNPRHIEGVEHFFFYNLERLTGRHFIHGQPVGLGVVLGSMLQDNEPERILDVLVRAGVDIRPEAMGVGWDDVAESLRTLPAFVREAGLWYTVVDSRPVPDDLAERARERVTARFGPWEAPP